MPNLSVQIGTDYYVLRVNCESCYLYMHVTEANINNCFKLGHERKLF